MNMISGERITMEDVDAAEGNDIEDVAWSEEQLNPPLQLRPCPALEAELRNGLRLHAFRSGGGLRVIYLADDGHGPCSPNGKGYGEHPNIEEAIRLAEEDCAAGGREYEEVYGKLVPQFLTGTSNPSSPLDRWILMGRAFDVKFEQGEFVFCSEFICERNTPKEIREQVVKAAKKVERYQGMLRRSKSFRKTARLRKQLERYCQMSKVQFVLDGFTFECSAHKFPSGELCGSTRFVKGPDVTGRFSVWFYNKTVTIRGGSNLESHFHTVNAELPKYLE